MKKPVGSIVMVAASGLAMAAFGLFAGDAQVAALGAGFVGIALLMGLTL